MFEGNACETAQEPVTVSLARRVARLSDREMSQFVKAFEESKREPDLKVGDRSAKVNQVEEKEPEAPGLQKWLVLVNERTGDLFQEIYALENELRPLLRVVPPDGASSPSTTEPFLVVDLLALHHNALSHAAGVLRDVRRRLQL